MRIAFWVSALLAAACAGPETGSSAARSAPVEIAAVTENATTRFEFQTSEGVRSSVTATRDGTVAPNAPPEVKVLGDIEERAIVLIDTYPSIPGGLSMCQAGEERFLRVIALTGEKARETFRVKVASCRDNLELAAPAVEWLPESSTVRIHWLFGPDGGKPEVRTIRLGRDGEPQPAPA